jgi:hypothetical protein
MGDVVRFCPALSISNIGWESKALLKREAPWTAAAKLPPSNRNEKALAGPAAGLCKIRVILQLKLSVSHKMPKRVLADVQSGDSILACQPPRYASSLSMPVNEPEIS